MDVHTFWASNFTFSYWLKVTKVEKAHMCIRKHLQNWEFWGIGYMEKNNNRKDINEWKWMNKSCMDTNGGQLKIVYVNYI